MMVENFETNAYETSLLKDEIDPKTGLSLGPKTKYE